MKIGVGSILKSKVVWMEDKPREIIIRRTSKEVVVCVQYVVGKKKFLVKFNMGRI